MPLPTRTSRANPLGLVSKEESRVWRVLVAVPFNTFEHETNESIIRENTKLEWVWDLEILNTKYFYDRIIVTRTSY